MVKYLVAVDKSPYSKSAFYTALSMLKKDRDTLFLISVGEDLSYNYASSYVPATLFVEAEEKIKEECKQTLRYYSKLAKAQNVTVFPILGISNHVGEVICQAVDKKNIDFVIIGRRGMNKIKRFFMGSTSKYVLEHANANVIVVKDAFGPPELHDDKNKVIQLEEEERKRRIEEEKEELKNEEERRKFQSSLDKNIAILAEETERMLRIKEEEERIEKEKQDREAAHIGAVIDEEEERKRRIKEEGIIDDREHHVEIFKINE